MPANGWSASQAPTARACAGVAAIDRLGAEVITSSPEGLARLIAQDTVRYGEIVRRIGAKLD